MSSRHLAAAAAVLALSACDAPVAEPGAQRGTGPIDAPPAALARPVVKSLDVAEVRWPARSAVHEPSLERLRPEARAAVARSRVPVLVPNRASMLPRVVVMPDAHYTALSIPADDPVHGVTVSLHTTRIAHRYPEIPTAIGVDVVRGHDAWVTENEAIWSATWTEHGVSYVLEVECARPGDDPRCANDAYVRALAEELVFVGGDFGEGGAR